VNSYQYDSANRLTSVNNVNYTFDDNGNLLSDGTNTYTYDSANRLTTVNGPSSTVNYAYNGLGDRYTQTVNNQTTTYVLDLNAGLTQVLSDNENTYLYGLGRISQQNTATLVTDYFLGDALGSVRQMTNHVGEITLVNTYEPYGTTLSSAGDSETPYGFTGEYTDTTGNIYLRARYYNPSDGRFLSRDTWAGDINNPLSLNRWMYVEGNPVNYVDPTGMKPSESHFKYCSPLSGIDSQYCNNIVRGIHPDTKTPWVQYFLYDLFGEDCDVLNLHESLPHSIGLNTPVANGWWFHYLLEATPGWWNNGGQDHVYFSDVIAIAIGAEMAQVRDYGFGILMAQGFAIKGWKEGMYYTLGGKESVTRRVNDALYGSNQGGTYRICGDTTSSDNCKPFSEVTDRFTSKINEVRLDLAEPFVITNNVRDLGHMVLWNSTWKNNLNDPNAPYEWGNMNSHAYTFPRLVTAMGVLPVGTEYNQVLWRSNDGLAYVVSQPQLSYLCEGKSCVHP
jgi:RHS repeat-associated protein